MLAKSMKKPISIICLLFALSTAFGQVQKVNISCEGVVLNAFMYEAVGGGSKATIIWMHGNPGGKEEGKSPLALELSNNGVNVLRFNYRGLWGTDGTFTMSNNLEELEAALEFLLLSNSIESFNIDTSRIIIGGYSHGANIALIHAIHTSKIKEFICLGPSDMSYLIREYFNPSRLDIRKFAQTAKDALWGEDGLIKDFEAFFNDILWNNYKYDHVAQAEKLLDKKILFIAGLNDKTSIIEQEFLPLYRRLMELNHPNITVEMTMSDHSFSDISNEVKAKMIIDWINKN